MWRFIEKCVNSSYLGLLNTANRLALCRRTRFSPCWDPRMPRAKKTFARRLCRSLGKKKRTKKKKKAKRKKAKRKKAKKKKAKKKKAKKKKAKKKEEEEEEEGKEEEEEEGRQAGSRVVGPSGGLRTFM
jgi:hypothetical protein